MELSNVALTKISKDSTLYRMLKDAAPDKLFTAGDEILVQFGMQERLPIPSGPNHAAQAQSNREAINANSGRAKQALEAIDGLTINNFWGGIATARVSGSAKAIVAALELPEISDASCSKGVTFRPATGAKNPDAPSAMR